MSIKIILIVLFIMNFVVSFSIANRDDIDVKQKIYQILLVWALPIIGALGLFVFYKSQDEKIKPRLTEFGGGTSNSSAGSHGGGDGG